MLGKNVFFPPKNICNMYIHIPTNMMLRRLGDGAPESPNSLEDESTTISNMLGSFLYDEKPEKHGATRLHQPVQKIAGWTSRELSQGSLCYQPKLHPTMKGKSPQIYQENLHCSIPPN